MKRGDIHMVSLDPAFGREQQGHRPVLVISSDMLNQLSKLPVVLPITSRGNFARAIGMSVSLADAGTKTVGIIRCDQPRVVDLQARGSRRVESVPADILEEVLAKVIAIFE